MSPSTAGAGADTATARKARMARVRARMVELDVDALLLSHGADLPWLTGYRAMPLERLTLLVLPAEGDPVLVVPALEAPRVPLGDAPDDTLFTLRPWLDDEDPIAIATDIVAAVSKRLPTLAISDRAWAMSLLALQQGLPEARWAPASGVTSSLRAVKDAAEIEVLRAAGEAADRVAHSLQAGDINLLGRTESEVSDEISARLIAEGHRRVNFAIVGSGPNGASPHHSAGSRRIGRGDVVVCDFGGELVAPSPSGSDPDGAAEDVGYCSDITRTVVVGDPTSEVRDCYEVLRAAQHAAVAAVAVGVAAADIDAAARAVITDAGLGERFIHRTGHGIGIEEHEDPYVVAGNSTPLQVGHAFSIEPGIYVPGRFGMRLEDIVVVSETGADPLNAADHSMVVVDG